MKNSMHLFISIFISLLINVYSSSIIPKSFIRHLSCAFTSTLLFTATPTLIITTPLQPAFAAPSADDQGANAGTNTKIKKGGASTLQQGISKVSISILLLIIKS